MVLVNSCGALKCKVTLESEIDMTLILSVGIGFLFNLITRPGNGKNGFFFNTVPTYDTRL